MIAINLLWHQPPKELVLDNNEAHIWRADLDLAGPEAEYFCRFLSKDELERAGSFYFQQDRRRFVVNRGILRMILSRYLHKDPGQIVFYYGPFGKPALAKEPGLKRVHFNLSHSASLALYTVVQNQNVGIDIEQIRSDFPWDRIAKRFFCTSEYETLRAIPRNLRSEAFFNDWTCKEAYGKATGRGLSLPLNQIEISRITGKPADRLNVPGERIQPSRWLLLKFRPAKGYVGCLVVERPCLHVKGWQWQERPASLNKQSRSRCGRSRRK